MRVAMAAKGLFPYSIGGLEKFTAFLANALVDLGVYVEVIAPGGKPLVNGFVPKYKEVFIQWPNIKPHKLSYYIFSKHVRDYLIKSKFDCAYGNGSALWTYVDAKKIPCIYSPLGMEEYKDPRIVGKLEKPFQLLFNRKIARKSDAIISQGGKLTDEIIRFLRVSRDKVHVIPNAVDLSHIDSFKPQHIKRENNRFLYVGKISYNKGIIDLVEAFKKIKEEVELCVVGSGPLMKTLIEGNKDPRIRFLGKVEEDKLFELFWSSDAFVYPTIFEGMPTVVIEAMACRLPVISTHIGGLPDLVDQQNGFIVPPRNPELLAETINKYISLPDSRKDEMRNVSRLKVESRFTWQKVAKSTLDLMNTLVH
jgi:glycosyltransferase involved in cell wall biosynthesis